MKTFEEFDKHFFEKIMPILVNQFQKTGCKLSDFGYVYHHMLRASIESGAMDVNTIPDWIKEVQKTWQF